MKFHSGGDISLRVLKPCRGKDQRGIKMRIFKFAFFFLTVLCLLIEGSLMLFGALGPFFPQPRLTNLLHINWFLLAIALCFFFRWSLPTLVLAWSFFLLSLCMWWFMTSERSLVWFIYENILPISTLVFSHIAAIKVRKAAQNVPV